MLLASLSSCATYYQKNIVFYKHFESGNFKAAAHDMKSNKRGPTGRDRLLYNLNLGSVKAVMGDYDLSNRYFEEAYRISDDYVKDPGREILSYLINPTVTVYRGEDHELLLLHYYKALNFLKMGQPEAALVECRRLINRSNQIADKYKEQSKKYKRDAFAHMFMGFLFEANGQTNDAFIAYRNAVEIYETDYADLFDMQVPNQLKRDLIRTAYTLGLESEAMQYEEKFGIQHRNNNNKGNGELVFLWHNGLSPIKSEWTIGFNVNQRGDQNFVISNSEMNLSYSFNNLSSSDAANLASLSTFRIAFPKYVERKPYFEKAAIEYNGKLYPMELGQDINKVAFQVLKQRMLAEIGSAILRVAIKKGAEELLKATNTDEGKAAGMLLGVFNAVTEQADTRAWQITPHDIQFVRIPMPEGEHEVVLHTYSRHGDRNYPLKVRIERGQMRFQSFHSLQVSPLFRNPYGR